MEIPQDVLRTCVGLGLLACRLPSMREDTINIFEAMKAAAPDSPSWIIGIGMVHANADDDPAAACRFMMKQGVSAGSGDLLARAFLGLFLVMAGRASDAERVASAVVDDGSDADATRLARSLLDNEINRS
ncbi:MAG: hypothetical protein OXU72_14965 [Gammaproteobacteria bacterium]|nr:hypothetical protein [Gammaproteobacteria bacterium]